MTPAEQLEQDDLDALNIKLGNLLKRTAIALKGPEPALTMWSWHDLPEIAQRLVDVGKELYVAGRWECPDVPKAKAADLFMRFRDALGLAKGSATALGVGDTDAPTYRTYTNKLESALRSYRKRDHPQCIIRSSDGLDNRCNRCKATDKLLAGGL